jgi:hypothetical protein
LKPIKSFVEDVGSFVDVVELIVACEIYDVDEGGGDVGVAGEFE